MGRQRFAESLPQLRLPAQERGRFRRERAPNEPHAQSDYGPRGYGHRDYELSGRVPRASDLRASGFRASVPNDRGYDRVRARDLRELHARAHVHVHVHAHAHARDRDRDRDRALRENDRNGYDSW